jgi:hypothetical protein
MTVKYRTIKALFLYINLCLSVMLDSLSSLVNSKHLKQREMLVRKDVLDVLCLIECLIFDTLLNLNFQMLFSKTYNYTVHPISHAAHFRLYQAV